MADYPAALPPIDMQAAARNHGQGWDEIYAIAAELGIDPSAPFTTVKESLAARLMWCGRGPTTNAYWRRDNAPNAAQARPSAMYVYPYPVMHDFSMNAFHYRVTVAGGVGSTADAVLYRDSNGYPGALVTSFAGTPIDVAGNIIQAITSIAITRGLYWIGVIVRAVTTNPTMSVLTGFPAQGGWDNSTIDQTTVQDQGFEIVTPAGIPNPAPAGGVSERWMPLVIARAA